MSFRCTRCGEEKTFEEMGKTPRNKNGVHSWCLVCMAAERQRYKQKYPEKRLHDTARTRARKRGLEFDLEVSDIVIPTHCPLLGMELVWDVYNARADNKPSLDRKDSSKGYTADNVWVVSWLANRIMTNAEPETIRTLASNLYKLEEE